MLGWSPLLVHTRFRKVSPKGRADRLSAPKPSGETLRTPEDLEDE